MSYLKAGENHKKATAASLFYYTTGNRVVSLNLDKCRHNFHLQWRGLYTGKKEVLQISVQTEKPVEFTGVFSHSSVFQFFHHRGKKAVHPAGTGEFLTARRQRGAV